MEINRKWFVGNVVFPVIILSFLLRLFWRPIRKAFQVYINHLIHGFSITVNEHFGSKKRSIIYEQCKNLLDSSSSSSIRILDVGAGQGWNIQFFPSGSSVICVEPDKSCQGNLERNISKHPGVKLEKICICGAEDMHEIESGSIDLVVATHVLCSVEDIKKSLSEILRVLRKVCGKFHLLYLIMGLFSLNNSGGYDIVTTTETALSCVEISNSHFLIFL